MMIRESRDNRATQRLKGFSDHYLLALISTRGVYGFELIRAMEESALTPQCSEGTVYGLLKRLESQGLVASHEEIGQTNRRRRYYRILPEGEKKLAEWNEQWSRFREGMDSIISG
jgi:PadR family transcriptional regulator PadR